MEIIQYQAYENLHERMETLASDNSLLIYLTDWNGNILFSTDEHAAAYRKSSRSVANHDNPYHTEGTLWNWQIGAYRNLPDGYAAFLNRLAESADVLMGERAVGYLSDDGLTYIFGADLSHTESVLYLSIPLDAVTGTVQILRSQLLIVTLASLALGNLMARQFSRQFSAPINAVTKQAECMLHGQFDTNYEKGFCVELDALSDTMEQTAISLQRLENARRELMGNISHDLRTPLTLIKGYAEMVQEISWKDETQRNEDLSVIIREANRLTELVNEILEYSAIRSLPIQQEPFNLSDTVAAVTKQFLPLCAQKGYDITAEPGTSQWTIGDEAQIKRVLYNLLDNAIRHSGNAKKIRLTLKETGRTIRVEVRDYGTGISKEDIPYIWDRYFKARQRRSGGSGLGLAITKEILEQHKAAYGVESEEGAGSTFWFELQKAKEK